MTTKVFVGNLAFQTTDQALAEAFQDCGRVKSGVVITRGRRSLGYGFVEFDSPEAALNAVKSKNNTLLKARTLKVELASDNPIRADRISSNASPAISAQPDLNNSGPGGGVGPRRRRRNNRRRRGVKPNGPGGDNQPISSPQNPQSSSDKPPGGPGGPGGENPRNPRRRRNNPPNTEDRVLSKTAVFVANLPFEVKDADLLQFFKDNNAKAAHVVVTRNGRSRGYGFVDFEGEKDQQNAIATKHNAKFSERVITVTPSYKTQEVLPENNM